MVIPNLKIEDIGRLSTDPRYTAFDLRALNAIRFFWESKKRMPIAWGFTGQWRYETPQDRDSGYRGFLAYGRLIYYQSEAKVHDVNAALFLMAACLERDGAQNVCINCGESYVDFIPKEGESGPTCAQVIERYADPKADPKSPFNRMFSEPDYWREVGCILSRELYTDEATARIVYGIGSGGLPPEEIGELEFKEAHIRFGFPPPYIEDTDRPCWYGPVDRLTRGVKPVWIIR